MDKNNISAGLVFIILAIIAGAFCFGYSTFKPHKNPRKNNGIDVICTEDSCYEIKYIVNRVCEIGNKSE